jgi:hypothetical protein
MIATENRLAGARVKDGRAVARGAAHCLILAAAPAFAVMALGSGLLGGDPEKMTCSTHEASPLNGMAVMYVLMSAFHLPPWLKLIANWRGEQGN